MLFPGDNGSIYLRFTRQQEQQIAFGLSVER